MRNSRTYVKLPWLEKVELDAARGAASQVERGGVVGFPEPKVQHVVTGVQASLFVCQAAVVMTAARTDQDFPDDRVESLGQGVFDFGNPRRAFRVSATKFGPFLVGHQSIRIVNGNVGRAIHQLAGIGCLDVEVVVLEFLVGVRRKANGDLIDGNADADQAALARPAFRR
jgi:hypothetical protein